MVGAAVAEGEVVAGVEAAAAEMAQFELAAQASHPLPLHKPQQGLQLRPMQWRLRRA
ncbi:MAG: hypothetical protein Hens2KO_21240 [Henriciella sp.]